MNFFLIPIIIFAKFLTWILKSTGKGSGTALPGRIIEKFFPKTLSKLVKQIPNVIVITGTNGKTTTQTLLNGIFKNSNINTITNSAGANLSRGLLSELLKKSNFWGKLECSHAIFEVEEATLPKIVENLNPKYIAVTNLYRDQLDAYGEVDITEEYIRQGIEKCPKAQIILNLDDPRTSRLTQNLPNKTFYVSISDKYSKQLPYEGKFSNKQKKSLKLIKAKNIKVNEDLTTNFDLKENIDKKPNKISEIKLNAPGFFHIYNALISYTISRLVGIKKESILKGISQFNPAFGRGELLTKIQNKKKIKYQLLLVKNPAGFTLNLDLIRKIKNLKVILLLNDNTADGKDVSWIWDANVGILKNSDFEWIICGGIRSQDLRVRLKYAIGTENEIFIDSNIKGCINKSFKMSKNNDTVYVLPTYTAMLKFRKLLGKKLED